MSLSALNLLSSISFKFAGLSEKKAASEPDTRLERTSKITNTTNPSITPNVTGQKEISVIKKILTGRGSPGSKIISLYYTKLPPFLEW